MLLDQQPHKNAPHQHTHKAIIRATAVVFGVASAAVAPLRPVMRARHSTHPSHLKVQTNHHRRRLPPTFSMAPKAPTSSTSGPKSNCRPKAYLHYENDAPPKQVIGVTSILLVQWFLQLMQLSIPATQTLNDCWQQKQRNTTCESNSLHLGSHLDWCSSRTIYEP